MEVPSSDFVNPFISSTAASVSATSSANPFLSKPDRNIFGTERNASSEERKTEIPNNTFVNIPGMFVFNAFSLYAIHHAAMCMLMMII